MIKEETAPVKTNDEMIANNGPNDVIASYAEGTTICACRATLNSGTLMFFAILMVVLYAIANTKKRDHVIGTLASLLGSVVGGLLTSFYTMFSYFTFYIIVPYWLLLALLAVTWLVIPAAVEDLVFLVYVTSGHCSTLAGEWLVKWMGVMAAVVWKI